MKVPPASTARTASASPSGLALVYRFSLAALITLSTAQAAPGNPKAGREIVASRKEGLCLLCHQAPIPEEPFQGNLAPDLAGVGERLTPAQLRQRIEDSSAINPGTIMPSYFKTTGLTRVAPSHRGQTILTAQQVEDVVAYLATLRAGESK